MKTYVVKAIDYAEQEHQAERMVVDGEGHLWLYEPALGSSSDPYAAVVAVYPRGQWMFCMVKAQP